MVTMPQYFGAQAVLRDFTWFSGKVDVCRQEGFAGYSIRLPPPPPKPRCDWCKDDNGHLLQFEGQTVRICWKCVGRLVMWAGDASGLSSKIS